MEMVAVPTVGLARSQFRMNFTSILFGSEIACLPATESPSLISSLVFSVRGGSWTTSSAERRALRPSDEHWMCPMAPCPSSTTAPRSTRGSGATMRPWGGHGLAMGWPWGGHGFPVGWGSFEVWSWGWWSCPQNQDYSQRNIWYSPLEGATISLASLKWWFWATFVAWLWEKTVWRVWTFPVAMENCWWPPWMTTGLYRLLNYMSSIWPLSTKVTRVFRTVFRSGQVFVTLDKSTWTTHLYDIYTWQKGTRDPGRLMPRSSAHCLPCRKT